ncbi:Uncharacterised protein (plasmid) [Legionella adelaidensis]|uniref:Inverse autotransporter beta-domain domain-containing protein n=1 Tax=Legionella adelaidensis TaxID=45056 RepID=A0A0W0R1Z6_9GAMM|nr:hypothetical protein [Legionella adelaidensis]KTC65077.1 hypothetical protein Lade_1600 [Legionella adelaidensis]VEH85403.1 Uncharacterised protein [Legionella adelaidensis]
MKRISIGSFVILFLGKDLCYAQMPRFTSSDLSSSGQSSQIFPLSSRILGAAAITNIGLFGGDGMLPLVGNKEKFLYGDLLGGYGTNNTYLVSPGLGYRGIIRDVIFGGYLFGDYDRTNLNKNFWVISPGVELISTRWDLHVNGYFSDNSKPLGSNVEQTLVNQVDQFETGTHNQFTQLTYNHQLVSKYAVIGNGFDAALGFNLAVKENLRSHLYLGGYYYNPPAKYNIKNIGGVAAGCNQPINQTFSFSLFNSYDQINKYTIGIGFNVVFGGAVNILSNDLHDRELDPVQRHIGIIATGAGTYDQKSELYRDYGTSSSTSLVYSNIYFISPDGTGNGTYGNPAPLTQETLNDINNSSPNDARLYLQGGTGSIYNVTLLDGLKPFNGQNFYGRSFDYTSTAVGNNRPTLFLVNNTDGYQIFHLGVNGTTSTFSDLQFTTNFESGLNAGIGIFMGGGFTDTTINNSSFSNFRTAIYLPDNGDLNITGSTFTNNNTVINSSGSENNFSIQNSTITADSDFDFQGTQPGGIQLINTGAGTVTFTADQLQINLNNNNSNSALSFLNQFNGQINATISNSTITGAGSGGNNGFEIRNQGNGDGSVGFGGAINVTVENSLLQNNGQANNTGNIYLQANNSGIINFSFINSTSSLGSTYGLLVVNGDLNPNLGDTVNVSIQNALFDRSGGNIGPPFPFGNIGVWSLGQGAINLTATNSIISNSTNGAPALWVSNGADGGVISNSMINISNLSGTTFLNNNAGGIYAYALAGVNTSTTINYTGAIFSNSVPNIANDPASTGTITWIPIGP